MAKQVVTFTAVHKAYQDKAVIGNLDLELAQGEVVALCGGNGAGKSTLLRMLAGVIRPTAGQIAINGVRWEADRRRYAQQLGYMPDDYQFSPGLTAMETMLFWARLRGLDRQHAAEALERVGLANTEKKPVVSFSKGMRQRVLFAQALLANAPLIVMDEPTNGLDPYWMESFVSLVRQAAAAGQTVLFSTHQLQIAEAVADRIIFLRDGAVVLDGQVAAVKAAYGGEGLNQAFGQLFGLASHEQIK